MELIISQNSKKIDSISGKTEKAILKKLSDSKHWDDITVEALDFLDVEEEELTVQDVLKLSGEGDYEFKLKK